MTVPMSGSKSPLAVSRHLTSRGRGTPFFRQRRAGAFDVLRLCVNVLTFELDLSLTGSSNPETFVQSASSGHRITGHPVDRELSMRDEQRAEPQLLCVLP
jgi:hypothetical protein